MPPSQPSPSTTASHNGDECEPLCSFRLLLHLQQVTALMKVSKLEQFLWIIFCLNTSSMSSEVESSHLTMPMLTANDSSVEKFTFCFVATTVRAIWNNRALCFHFLNIFTSKVQFSTFCAPQFDFPINLVQIFAIDISWYPLSIKQVARRHTKHCIKLDILPLLTMHSLVCMYLWYN